MIGQIVLSIIDDWKNDGLIKKLFIGVALFFILIPISIMAYLFPYNYSESKNDPYMEVVRELNVENVFTLDDIKIIDLVVFLNSSNEQIMKVNKTELTNRFKKYYLSKIDKNDNWQLKSYLEIIQNLKERGILTKEKEKELNSYIEMMNKSDPTILDMENIPVSKGKLILPLKHFTVTSVPWAYPGGGWHPGLDFGVPINTPVYSPINTVKLMQNDNTDGSGYGIWTTLAGQIGSDSYVFIFAHFQANNGKSNFKQGDIVGYSGNTGNSTGPHLHYEIIFLKNTTLQEVVKRYKATRDYWFGLGYTSKGDCSKICRIDGAKYHGLKLNQVK